MKSTTQESLAIFARHAWQYKHQAIAMVIGLVLTVGLHTSQPFILKMLVDSAYSNEIDAKVGMMFLVYLLTATNFTVQLIWRILGFINNDYQPKVMRDLTRSGFAYLLHHSQGFFADNFVGSIVAKLKRFPTSYERISDVVQWNFIPTACMIVLLMGILTYQWPLVGLFILIWALIYIGFAYKFSLYKLKFDIESAEQD
nr:hypothetical protein [bacterium]